MDHRFSHQTSKRSAPKSSPLIAGTISGLLCGISIGGAASILISTQAFAAEIPKEIRSLLERELRQVTGDPSIGLKTRLDPRALARAQSTLASSSAEQYPTLKNWFRIKSVRNIPSGPKIARNRFQMSPDQTLWDALARFFAQLVSAATSAAPFPRALAQAPDPGVMQGAQEAYDNAKTIWAYGEIQTDAFSGFVEGTTRPVSADAEALLQWDTLEYEQRFRTIYTNYLNFDVVSYEFKTQCRWAKIQNGELRGIYPEAKISSGNAEIDWGYSLRTDAGFGSPINISRNSETYRGALPYQVSVTISGILKVGVETRNLLAQIRDNCLTTVFKPDGFSETNP